MIGNNHHLDPVSGEDFQMFEKDLPGENKSGLSFQQPSDMMPLETCETMNDSWGYNITDRHYKTVKQVIQLLVGAAGRNTNLLLNVGPMPNGQIQKEFTDTLLAAGEWLQQYGASVYNTRGKIMPPQPWGVATRNGKQVYLHLLQSPQTSFILLPGFSETIISAEIMGNRKKLKWSKVNEGVFIYPEYPGEEIIDHVIQITVK